MTPEQAQRIANFMRRKAAGLSPNCIEFAGELREAADIIEAAAAPPQPATVEPRCDRCKWWNKLEFLYPKGFGKCVRLAPGTDNNLRAAWPTTLECERCGEFAPREVQP